MVCCHACAAYVIGFFINTLGSLPLGKIKPSSLSTEEIQGLTLENYFDGFT